MPLTLEEWDFHIGYRLETIEYYSEMLEYHARELLSTPQWETKADDKLVRAEFYLSRALQRVRQAQRDIAEKSRAE